MRDAVSMHQVRSLEWLSAAAEHLQIICKSTLRDGLVRVGTNRYERPNAQVRNGLSRYWLGRRVGETRSGGSTGWYQVVREGTERDAVVRNGTL